MRQTEVINQEIRDLDRIIENGNSLIKQFPNDNLIPLSIEQAKHRKQMLIKERDDSSSNLMKSVVGLLYLIIATIFKKSRKKETHTANQQKLPTT